MTTTTAELTSLLSLDAALESARAGAATPGTGSSGAAGAPAASAAGAAPSAPARPPAAGALDVLAAARELLALSGAVPVPTAGPPA